ncbi:MAG: glycoside hydrolase family 127 protein [Clostridia bacterium]|nr:glycoside hydrolase family 127 protein [Clostridia bacterium]
MIENRLNSTGEFSYSGISDDMIRFIEKAQLKDTKLWDLIIEQFSTNSDDADDGWRCEYWGKLMRGACVVYEYTKDRELYNILLDATKRLIEKADNLGRISTYSVEHEFCGWDMWGRKYVLLGLIHFFEICHDEEFGHTVIETAKAHLDYIISKIGEDKIDITETSMVWGGINSSSVLEPVVRLYSITKEQRYLDFAKYIVDRGGAKDFDIFYAAYEDKLYPYQYPVTKAYELMSCFEGLLEYYKVTGEEKYRTAVINFADKLIESEITIIGSAGCEHELFNHSALMQTYTGYDGLMQETCVTVTWIKLCHRLLLLTGNMKYADEIEKSVYNALYGAVNIDGNLCSDEVRFDLPYYKDVYKTYHSKNPRGQVFDSYSPLRLNIRGKAVGGFKAMDNNTAYFGCCIAIGAVGIGLVPKTSVLNDDNNYTFALYLPGKAVFNNKDGGRVEFEVNTKYPSDSKIGITVNTEGYFSLNLRVPYFADNYSVTLNNDIINTENNNGVITISREWHKNDVITLDLNMNFRTVRAPKNPDDKAGKNHIAFMYGPLVLARDERLENAGGVVSIPQITPEFIPEQFDEAMMACKSVKIGDRKIKLIDYASAGRTWRRNSQFEVWIRTNGG